MGSGDISEFPIEMWFRNPNGYVKELAEVGEYKLTWDYGLVKKTRLDPVKLCELYFGLDKPWRIIVVAEWGAAEYKPGDRYGNPSAVYPVFTYGESQAILEELLDNPWGEDADLCANPDDLYADRVPILGQENRLVITGLPDMKTPGGRSFLRYLAGKQQEYPECKIHIHGLTAFRPMFAYPFHAVDFEARTSAQGGRVNMPNGSIIQYERTASLPQWLRLMGVTVGDLAVPRNRCMFNIRSAVWSAKYYRSTLRFRSITSRGPNFYGMGNEEAVEEQPDDDISIRIRIREAEIREKVLNGEIDPPEGFNADATRKINKTPVDTKSSDKDFTPRVIEPVTAKSGMNYQPGDKVTCNSCSVAKKCKLFREGSVCRVPKSPGERLARAFSSRDADQIIDGLGNVLGMQSMRLERVMRDEEEFGENDPEVTKIMNSLFSNGAKLAKLINPALNGPGTTVNVGVGAGGSAQVTTGNPNTIMAQIVRALEEKGIPRSEITSDMVAGVLRAMNGGSTDDISQAPRAIEGVVVERANE